MADIYGSGLSSQHKKERSDRIVQIRAYLWFKKIGVKNDVQNDVQITMTFSTLWRSFWNWLCKIWMTFSTRLPTNFKTIKSLVSNSHTFERFSMNYELTLFNLFLIMFSTVEAVKSSNVLPTFNEVCVFCRMVISAHQAVSYNIWFITQQEFKVEKVKGTTSLHLKGIYSYFTFVLIHASDLILIKKDQVTHWV